MEPRQTGKVLGGQRVLGKAVTSLLELNDAVERGLPKATLRIVVQHVFPDASDQRALMRRIVPELLRPAQDHLIPFFWYTDTHGTTSDRKSSRRPASLGQGGDLSAGAERCCRAGPAQSHPSHCRAARQ